MQTLAAKYSGCKNISRSFELISSIGLTFTKVHYKKKVKISIDYY